MKTNKTHIHHMQSSPTGVQFEVHLTEADEQQPNLHVALVLINDQLEPTPTLGQHVELVGTIPGGPPVGTRLEHLKYTYRTALAMVDMVELWAREQRDLAERLLGSESVAYKAAEALEPPWS